LRSLESTPIDFAMESFVRYSKLELVLGDSKLEFIVEPKFPSLLVDFQFFNSALSKFAKPKLLYGSIDLYIGFPILATIFFQLFEIFS
jgi:hypothetical protein